MILIHSNVSKNDINSFEGNQVFLKNNTLTRCTDLQTDVV